MNFKNLLILLTFIVLSFLFFGMSIDNGFWNSYDFVSLENSVRMLEDPSEAFNSDPPFKFQPLVYGLHYLIFKNFYFSSAAYFIINILLHGLNSFLVYILVNSLLRDRPVSFLSALLFVCTVGSYGKTVMIASGFEDLIITSITLLTMIFYFKNELDGKGSIFSFRYLFTLIFFIASMFTRSTSFSILGAFIAFNFFFRNETGRRVFGANFMVLLVIAATSLVIKYSVFHYSPPLYTKNPGVFYFIVIAGKNVINYLVRMIFPIHTSHLVTESGPFVNYIYSFATAIRIFIALTVLSYSVFGFIFGNRAIRFLIAWTYIMVLPFAFFQFPYDWLNIRHLYLVSIGFVSVISAGAVYCSRLISAARWKRFVPFVVPLIFILLSRFIVVQLDQSYESKASNQATLANKQDFADKFPNVHLKDGELTIDR
ncbi:MAG: hypothetical protein JW746_03790 [Candidatus Krumholzibacteriota bacterium]|nr:hypothetical protein [Candidatus Krumholzibacteriota bacterium]